MLSEEENRVILRKEAFRYSLHLAIGSFVIGVVTFSVLGLTPTPPSSCLPRSNNILHFNKWMEIMGIAELSGSGLLFMVAWCPSYVFHITNVVFALWTIVWYVIGCYLFYEGLNACATFNICTYYGLILFPVRFVMVLATAALQLIAW